METDPHNHHAECTKCHVSMPYQVKSAEYATTALAEKKAAQKKLRGSEAFSHTSHSSVRHAD